MIQLENVTKRYGAATALNGISFEVERGQIVGFLGPNGAGKTTTMKILTGFISPTAGRVTVDGLELLEHSLEIRKRIGYLPENAPVYPDMTVRDYLTFVGEVRGLAGASLIKRLDEVVGLTGLGEVFRRDIGELSKGFRQRVGLAQALIHDPPILIMDEPTSGLDPNQIVEIREVIRRIGQEKTVILSTHILSEVEATTDRVIIINRGTIVADDRTEVLQARKAGARVNTRLELPPGITPDAARARLASLSGVTRVEDRGQQDGAPAFALDTRAPDDRVLRRDLFQLAVKEGWVLLELSSEGQSLEAVFQSLTRGEESK